MKVCRYASPLAPTISAPDYNQLVQENERVDEPDNCADKPGPGQRASPEHVRRTRDLI
jgi:hypothetical protein